MTEAQILVYQVPQPEPLYKLEARRRETLKLHAFAEYGLMNVKLYEDIAQWGRIDTTYDYPVLVNGRYVMSPSPIPSFDNPKLHRMPALQLFGAGREKRLYAIPPYTDVKSLDFIVVDAARLVVDVKGRKFPSGSKGTGTWQNWAEAEDIDALTRWAAHFGPGFRGVLAFVYHIAGPFELPPGTPDLFTFRDRTYLVRAVAADDYRAHMKPRSRRWATVHLGTADFRRLVKPFTALLAPAPVLAS